MADRRRPPRRARTSDPPHRRLPVHIWADPAYLELKERLGEVLTPRERFALELHRASGDPQPDGPGGAA
jgi:hypothetical protein